ncbi:MAG: hypothetical protein SH847_17900 [Roseiflexaceae bacterium]|nr:hypothetical protein [Roseiflexaceae bacterium]
MSLLNKRMYALIALAAGAILGIATRNRTPADIRRFEYHPTLIEEAYAIATDPLQMGMLAGSVVGAIGLALLRAGDSAARTSGPPTGLLLTVNDPALVERAAKSAEQAMAQIVEPSKK